MEFSFEARVVMTLEHKKGTTTSKHAGTDFNLFVLGDLDERAYLEDGLPNKEGSMVLSTVLIQGLVGNIHMAHQEGFRDSAEHLRWIIAELERGFAAVAEVRDSKFK